MTDKTRIAAAVTAIVFAPLGLAGCASPASFDDTVPPAVLASDENIVDTYLTLSNGVAGHGIRLRVYVTDTSDAAVAASIDAALDAAFHAAPSRPTGVTIDAAASPRPDKVNLNLGSLPLEGVTPLLAPPVAAINDWIHLSADELEERYGPWGADG